MEKYDIKVYKLIGYPRLVVFKIKDNVTKLTYLDSYNNIDSEIVWQERIWVVVDNKYTRQIVHRIGKLQYLYSYEMYTQKI